MRYDGLVIDIDNSIFNAENEDKHLEDIKAIKSLTSRNIPVIICTENDKEYAKRVIERFNIIEPAIIKEGAAVYSPFEVEFNFNFHLPLRTVKILCSWANENNVSISLMTSSGEIKYDKWSLALQKFVLNDESLCQCSIVNEVIMHISSDEVKTKLFDYTSNNDLDCYLRIRDKYIVQFMPKIDKVKALRYLAEKKKWNIKNFIALGKISNISSLFEEVGLGISTCSNLQDQCNIGKKDSNEINCNIIRKCVECYF
ncbi:HAD hydrolase family protein [Clostridium hydrogenum]|uniref:HAD hydrolase family protein n=1 Tax=Clostridium hydrogenum TaxID=2855764 RepID=UPI001F35F27D|nr:HAD hydrolase family protein [Clostridium hydrogenum]